MHANEGTYRLKEKKTVDKERRKTIKIKSPSSSTADTKLPAAIADVMTMIVTPDAQSLLRTKVCTNNLIGVTPSELPKQAPDTQLSGAHSSTVDKPQDNIVPQPKL